MLILIPNVPILPILHRQDPSSPVLHAKHLTIQTIWQDCLVWLLLQMQEQFILISYLSVWSVSQQKWHKGFYAWSDPPPVVPINTAIHRYFLWIDLQIRRSHGKSSGLFEIPISRANACLCCCPEVQAVIWSAFSQHSVSRLSLHSRETGECLSQPAYLSGDRQLRDDAAWLVVLGLISSAIHWKV